RLLSSMEKNLNLLENVDLADVLNRAKPLIDTANRLVENINQIDFNHIGTNAGSLIVEFRETNRGIQRTLADAQAAINGADLPAISRDTAALEAKLSDAAV